jgi:TonB family protein
MKGCCFSMIMGLAVGARAVTGAPTPKADPPIPRDELRKMVAAALSDRSSGRTITAGRRIPAARVEYVGTQSHQWDVPARFISGEGPAYPIKQWLEDAPGAVIGFTIDEQGNTKDFVIVGSTYHFFATHAIRAVQHWKFEPAKAKGKPWRLRSACLLCTTSAEIRSRNFPAPRFRDNSGASCLSFLTIRR